MCMERQVSPEDHEDVNVQFYNNTLRCAPDNALISEIHATYTHDQLELSHGYIQWLFPVYENQGMNPFSRPLSKEGARIIRGDVEMAQRVVCSYRLMLEFLGCRLVDEVTGEVGRGGNWEARYQEHNFEFNHNWLRISRIFTSLGELGFGRYKKPLLEHLRREVDAGTLDAARDSLEQFWGPLVEAEDTPAYKAKTQEDGPEDRGESVFFRKLLGRSQSDQTVLDRRA